MADLIRGSALLNFVQLVTKLGGDPRQLLIARGLDPAIAGDYDRFLSPVAAAAVVADAATTLDCPDFGLRLAREQGIQILGPVAVIIRNSETVAAALDGVSRYLHNVAPQDHIEVIRGPRVAVFSLTTTLRQPAPHNQWVEKGLGLSMDALRLMLGEEFAPLTVTLQHQQIGPLSSYREMFGCPIQFGANLNSLHLPSSALSRPIRGRDSAALALAERYLGGIGPDLEVTDHVRDLTQRLLAANQANLVGVARAMSLHPRVLQRRLANAGTSFEDILDEIRRDLAWVLSGTGMQVSRIASALGYSEQSSYSRACRRWFGQSPRELRKARKTSPTPRAAVSAEEPDESRQRA